jgi:acyl-coenzyme A thioesterase PaaI-like protein
VEAAFDCDPRYQSYPDRLHGGVVALLLDAAMTHCLFGHGREGLTARLNIRFRGKVELGVVAVVRARLRRIAHGVHQLEARLLQGDVVRAEAEARFVSRPRFEGG